VAWVRSSVKAPKLGSAATAAAAATVVSEAATFGPMPPVRRPGRCRPSVVAVPASGWGWDDAARRLATRFLEQAMSSRAGIEQAKGILMERLELSADQAFQALARASMERNAELRDVADHVVRTGEFPAG
jgi:hypothetical protein